MSLTKGICTGIRIACEGYKLVDDLFSEESTSLLKKGSVICQVASLTTSLWEIGANLNGDSNQKLKEIKKIEASARLGQLVCDGLGNTQKLMNQGIDERQYFTNMTALFSSCERAETELKVYTLKAQLDIPFDLRPSTQNVDKEGHLKETTKTDQQLQKTINSLQSSNTSFIETTSKVAIAVERSIELYQHLLNRLNQNNNQQQPADQNNNMDPFDLTAQNAIPDVLHEDEVFRRYICPITQLPIRHPVGDPNGKVLYERSAIIQWINSHHTSPITRLPLAIYQLVPKPSVSALINARLVMHSQLLRQAAQANLAQPSAQNLQSAANNEHPS